MNKVFFSAVLCFTVGVLTGGTLYVSPKGNDKNSGSLKAPFATIAHAAKVANPGDTVKIAPGIYREQIIFRKSGKKGAPITFEGVRGNDGSFLTIVEGNGVSLKDWKPAPEVAPNVWKTPLKRRPDLVMMDGKMITFINKLTMALPRMKKIPEALDESLIWGKFGPGCKRCPGLDLLSLKKDVTIRHRYFGDRRELFWPTIGNVLSGWRDGVFYIRFADGSTPAKHNITASYGSGFYLRGVSYLKFTNLHLRGSRYQFCLSSGSSNNVIDNCLLMHGGARVRIEKGADYNLVQHSILTSGFIRGDLFQLRSRNDMRGGMLYEIFKYIIGTALSDDMGVQNRGRGTIMVGNVFIQGLIGVEANGPECEFAFNTVMKMSSVGVYTGARNSGRYHNNLIVNNGIPIRIHDLRGAHAKRVEYHFNNLIIQAPHEGSLMYVHCESHRWGPDVVNFEPPSPKNKFPVYKKNPPKPVDPGKFFIYHNTFWGGQESEPGFYVGYYSRRFRSVLPFVFINNVIKGCHWWAPWAQDMLAGNLLYGYPSARNQKKLSHPEIKNDNLLIPESMVSAIWNKKNIPGLPDVTLAAKSPAAGIGVDVSRPFTYKGKKYPVLPGFAPGYFKGKKPAAGALQEGDSMERFVKMFRKAEKAVQIIKNAK